MVSKLNVNIRTLLNNCEELAKDTTNNWRLKKFIKSLDIMINELSEMDDFASNKKIPGYLERLQVLKKQTNYVENLIPIKNVKTVKTRGIVEEAGNEALREIRQLQIATEYAEQRKQLLDEDNRELRQRKPLNDNDGTGSIEQIEAIKYMRENQEKITEHMLSLTRNLKEQTITANRIIRKDTEIVTRSTGMADNNIGALNKETEKLGEHLHKAWKCWMWLMIMFVIITFIGMVLFMKMVKKKKY